jgi:hypothetical protein
MIMRKCKRCGEEGRCLYSEEKRAYLCKNCHEDPTDAFFSGCTCFKCMEAEDPFNVDRHCNCEKCNSLALEVLEFRKVAEKLGYTTEVNCPSWTWIEQQYENQKKSIEELTGALTKPYLPEQESKLLYNEELCPICKTKAPIYAWPTEAYDLVQKCYPRWAGRLSCICPANSQWIAGYQPTQTSVYDEIRRVCAEWRRTNK